MAQATLVIMSICELWKNEVWDANMNRCLKNERSEVVFMNMGGGKHSNLSYTKQQL
jgi:hypothetical protein